MTVAGHAIDPLSFHWHSDGMRSKVITSVQSGHYHWEREGHCQLNAMTAKVVVVGEFVSGSRGCRGS